MKKIGKKMCEVCKENISKAIIQNKFVCIICYNKIKNIQTVNGYSNSYFRKFHLKKILSFGEMINEVKKSTQMSQEIEGGLK